MSAYRRRREKKYFDRRRKKMEESSEEEELEPKNSNATYDFLYGDIEAL